jgi:hypothetical protein
MIAHNPLHGSRQAVLPHPALALGDDAHCPVREWGRAYDAEVRLSPRFSFACNLPVNASTLPLRAAPHDSRPMWVATSHSYDFCIHYTSPV